MSTTNLPFVPSSTKRHRASSGSSGISGDSPTRGANKATRVSSSPLQETSISQGFGGTAGGRPPSHQLICTLPPTCNKKPTPLASTKELESHYSKYHAHVCEQPGCGCVFPEPRLLELHQTENHDPLAALRKERGEKIFGCHLPTCNRTFMTPKARRLHLISAHGYPKEYFFAVTNKGVGGLLKKWGEGASMIRGNWKARDDGARGSSQSADGRMDVDTTTYRESMDVDDDGDDSDDEEGSASSSEDEILLGSSVHEPRAVTIPPQRGSGDPRMAIDPDATPRVGPASKPLPAVTPPLPNPSSTRPVLPDRAYPTARGPATSIPDPDSLASGFSSLSLVPPSVRFGRGGRSTGFGTRAVSNPSAAATPTAEMSSPKAAASIAHNASPTPSPASASQGGSGGSGTRSVSQPQSQAANHTLESARSSNFGAAGRGVERGRGRGRGRVRAGRGL